jgi:hypothetical protein
VITAHQLLPEVENALGQEVSLAYVRKLLKRHAGPKIGPGFRHIMADREAQREPEKDSPTSYRKSWESYPGGSAQLDSFE